MMKENLIAGIVGVAFVCAIVIPLLIFTGCFEGEEPIPTPTASEVQEYTPTEEDLEYVNWYVATVVVKLKADSDLIYAEMKGKSHSEADWDYIRTLAILQHNHFETALEEIVKFEVSPELEPSKTEFKLALIDGKWSAHYLKEAAEDYLSGDQEGFVDNVKKTSEYSKSSLAHREKAKALSHIKGT